MPPPKVSLSHMALRFPPVAQFLERFRAVLRSRRVFDFDGEVAGLSRVEQAVAFLALLELRRAARSHSRRPRRSLRSASRVTRRKGTRSGPSAPPDLPRQHRRNPIDALARTVEALLVVASQPLTVEELVDATEDDAERVETALGLLSRALRARGGAGSCWSASAGGYAFRAAREAAEACGRLFERPVERGLSQAALETLAIVAYLGPVSRPEIARMRGVAADSAVASLVERGLDRRGRPRERAGRRGALPRDAALRARLRARQPRRAAAARRPRRRRRGDPRAAARGRGSARLVTFLFASGNPPSGFPPLGFPACGGGRSLKASPAGPQGLCRRYS